MSHLGATLQCYNEEIVYLIEDLKSKLEALQSAIENDEKEKAILTAQIEELSRNLERVDESLKEKTAVKNGYEQTLREVNAAYEKIVQSSQTLIAVAKKKASLVEEMRSSEEIHES